MDDVRARDRRRGVRPDGRRGTRHRSRRHVDRLQAYINVEATGSGGTAMLFEAGPGNGWIVGAWARRAPHPRGASFGDRNLPPPAERHRLHDPRAPRHARPNFAPVGDSYAYHTARDTPERLSRTDAARRPARTSSRSPTALDAIDITQRTSLRTRRSSIIGGVGGAAATRRPVGWLAHRRARAGRRCLRLVQDRARGRPARRHRCAGCSTAVWSLAGLASVAAAMIGATWALRAAREVYHPWYAQPDRLFLLLLAVGVTSRWTMSRAWRLAAGARTRRRHPLVSWSLTLPALARARARRACGGPGSRLSLDAAAAGGGRAVARRAGDNRPAVRDASSSCSRSRRTLWLPEHGGAAALRAARLRPAARSSRRSSCMPRSSLVGGSWSCSAVHRRHRRDAPAAAAVARHRARASSRLPIAGGLAVLRAGLHATSSRCAARARAAGSGRASGDLGGRLDRAGPRSRARGARRAGCSVGHRAGQHPVGPLARIRSSSARPDRRSDPPPLDIAASPSPGRGRHGSHHDRRAPPPRPRPYRSCCRRASRRRASSLPGAPRLGRWTATYVAPPPEGLVVARQLRRRRRRPARATSRVVVTDSGFPGRRRLAVPAGLAAAGPRGLDGHRDLGAAAAPHGPLGRSPPLR